MTEQIRNQRLDEILLSEEKITQDQIKEALAKQKEEGGRFGSKLLELGFIDEAGLVRALARQMNSNGVVLTGLQIPEVVVKLIPRRVSRARKVVPFDYDLEANLIKIACEDPTDIDLFNELSFVAGGKHIQLFVAAEHGLNDALATYFPETEATAGAPDSEGEPDSLESTGLSALDNLETENSELAWRDTMLLVADDESEVEHLKSLLENDFYRVLVTDSADDAIGMLDNHRYHTVFIRDTVAGDYIDLIDRLRKISPRTSVRYYESASTLLLDKDCGTREGELLRRNLDLFTSLLSTRDKLDINHSGAVGRYVEKLCRKLELPAKDQSAVINAGYVHDLARFYHKIENPSDYRQMIGQTIDLLESIDYPPVVIEMLRSMYKDLKGRYTRRLPIEALGGNILTMVDLFCENMPASQHISLDKFDAFQMKIRELTGKLFLSEVAEAFIAMVKEEILQTESDGPAVQVMIYAQEPASVYTLELRMRHEGFRTISATSIESFAALHRRSVPDIIVLMPHGGKAPFTEVIDDLTAAGIDLPATPTFLIMDGAESARLSAFFEKGVDDVLAADGGLDLLLSKMHKIRQRLNELPQPNIDRSNESILMKKCRLLDEKARV